MSTVDPLEAALGEPEPQAAGTPEGGGADLSQHPIVQSRFGGDVAKALDAYANLDREYGRQGDQMGKQIAALQAEMEELRAQGTDPEPPKNSGGMALPDMSIDQLTEWFESDPAQATAYLIAQGQQMQAEYLNEMLDEKLAALDKRLEPVESQIGMSRATALIEGLKKELGDEVVARNVDALMQLREEDEDFFKGDPTAVYKRMRMAVRAADAENGQRGASNGAAASAPADVSVMGGSGGRNPSNGDGEPLSEAEEFRAALIGAQKEEHDMFGNPIRR